MSNQYQLAKYDGKWCVFCVQSRTFDFIGKGKRFCENKVKELND